MITIQQLELWGRTDPLIAGIYATQALSHLGGRYIQDGRIMINDKVYLTVPKTVLTTVLEARWAVKSCGLDDPRWMERRPISRFEGKKSYWYNLFTPEVAQALGPFEKEALSTDHSKIPSAIDVTIRTHGDLLIVCDLVIHDFGYYAGEV